MKRPNAAKPPTTESPRTGRVGLHLRAAAAALAITAVSCSSLSPIEPLQLTLADLEVSEVTLFETTLLAKLRITNPNPESFAIDGGSFKLTLDGKKIGSGTTPESFTVDRLDSVLVEAIFHINNASAVLRLKNVLQQKMVSYGVTGSLFTQGTFGTRKIRVDREGRLDLGEPALFPTEDAEASPPAPPR
jgi:LEA14-like dessication related protein